MSKVEYIAAKLTKARAAAGLNQEQFAQKVGLALEVVSKLESLKKTPSSDWRKQNRSFVKHIDQLAANWSL